MKILRSEQGQSAVLAVLFLTVLLGMSAVVVDVGSWYRADRATQAAADAGALAGAQELPEDPAEAVAVARDYVERNGGGDVEIELVSRVLPNDTLSVTVEREAPGFFAKVFGVDSAGVGARAAARSGNPTEARWVAPIVVNHLHPHLRQFGVPTRIDLEHLHGSGSGDAAGAFGLIRLRRTGGNAGSAEVAEWMARGFDQYMPLGEYHSVPSTMFNSSHFRNAMQLRTGDDVLFPIYRSIVRGGSTAVYDIIGWVGFHITEWNGGGSNGTVRGWFTRIITEGIQGQSGSDPDYGVRTISLVE